MADSDRSADSGILVVFDFDNTIIDGDSDRWVVENLGVSDLFRRLLHTMPWNALMNRMMAEVHSQGTSIEKIADCLKKMPLDSHFITAVKSAYSLGCDLRIVSDANMFFIETILEHHGLIRYFSEINTNSCHVDEDGKLRISPYHDFHSSSHGCRLCPPHMCKGVIIERIQVEVFEQGKTARFIYLGDGNGDYCPSLKLSKTDYVMPREDYPLCELISSNPMVVKAEVHKWTNANDQRSVLLKLIKKLAI